MDEIVVYVTTSSEEEGAFLGRTLVEKKLVACVNLIPHVRSIFQWEGHVSEEHECLMILKTTTDRFGALESSIKSQHSYEVPEIIALPIVRGSAEYLTWMHEMVFGE